MNLFRRGMIFATFFGCCCAIALQAAAIGTTYWIESNAQRIHANDTVDHQSTGHYNFGLFSGTKELDFGIGTRRSTIDGKLCMVFMSIL